MPSFTRRAFLKSTTAAAAGVTILRSSLYGASPNDKLRTAHIGVGGMGRGDLRSVSSHPLVEVVALCDVDSNNLAQASKDFPQAKTFADYRKLFDELASSVDAVVVSTPDHTHAPAAMTALQHGKHVYCQKPLTHEIFEARRLAEVAAEKNLVTQMGVQGHADQSRRAATQMIQDGVIGKVSAVHAWSFKDWGYDGGPIEGSDPIPDSLDWNLWLGTAPERPFKKDVYHPGNWRKIVDFGTGTLGDMGVHIFDTPYRALKLTAPNWAKTSCRPPTNVGHPEKNVVEYEFPGTEHTTEKLSWIWYDGAFAPPRDRELPLPKETSLPDQGAVFIGEKGTLLFPHGGAAELFPANDFAGYKWPEFEPLDHYHQWVDACLGKTKASAHFGYAGPLTEALLLGVVANRYPDTKLEWDSKQMVVKNLRDPNRLIRRKYRAGFEVEGL